MVTSALDGFNVCVFCYGQTGAGKTHTLAGEKGTEQVRRLSLSRTLTLALSLSVCPSQLTPFLCGTGRHPVPHGIRAVREGG